MGFSKIKRGWGFLTFLFIVISCPSAVFAAIIHVPGDEPTIQAGIGAASNGDTVLVADGTYTGDGNKNLDFGGKAITVRSENGPETCIIDCEGSGRGFHFHSGENPNSVVDGFKIINGYSGYLGSGGGIYCELSSGPTIMNCVISDNIAYRNGGGIYCMGAVPIIKDCIITDNSASNRGGGIFLYYNGVIFTPIITNCIIANNSAGAADSQGGGVYFESNGLEGSPLFVNCTITGNSADTGGGIHFEDSSQVEIVNCTFSANSANSALFGRGIYCWDHSSLTVTNCILWDDSLDYDAQISVAGESHLTISYSNIWNGAYGINVLSGCTLDFDYESNIGWDWVDGEDDPLFAGGGDYHLTAGSPCIDAGTETGAPGNDIDGDTRPQGAGYDMGSDEYMFNCPLLTSGGVLPDSGTTSRSFRFSVQYYHQDDVSPTTMHVVIDGSPHEMSLVLGLPADGKYAFDITGSALDLGTHSYYFLFVDEHGCSTRLPSSGSYSGPTVNNSCPLLSNADLDPDRGDMATQFSFEVRYYDSDGHPPTTMDVVIDDSPHSMSLCSGSSANGFYCFATTGSDLGLGTHSYYFLYEDGYGCSMRLPELENYTTEIIEENHCPSLTNGDVDPDSGNTTTLFRFTVDYWDPDGTSSALARVVINNVTQTMAFLSGEAGNGTYYLDTLLHPDSVYYFLFDDGFGCSARLPDTGTFDGPMVMGQTHFVPDDYPDILTAVNNSSSYDVIIVRDGVYTGDNNKNIAFDGKVLTLRSENGPFHCIIDCEGSGRGFDLGDWGSSGSVIEGFTIVNGSTTGSGGGIYSEVSVTIRNCRIIGNSAQNGGGIYLGDSTAGSVIVNCLILANTANITSGYGGGIFLRSMFHPDLPISITHCSVVNNTAYWGGGIGHLNFSNLYCNIDMFNTILWGNGAAYGPQLAASGWIFGNLSYCNVQGGDADIHGGAPWGEGNIDEPPVFVDTTASSYTDWDLHLQPDSPCIDAGTNNAPEMPDTDLDGRQRVLDGDENGTAIADMGACEFAPFIKGDFNKDRDVDGLDLAVLAEDPRLLDLSLFSVNFGFLDPFR